METVTKKQEPVALPCCGYANAEAVKWNPHNQVVQCHNCGHTYTPQRQPLTDEQIEKLLDAVIADKTTKDQIGDFARAIEAAHGITKS